MQIVIDIPDDKIPSNQCYKDVLIKFVDKQVCEVTLISQDHADFEKELFFDVLPEGHGRLIDADEIQFENTEFETYGDYCKAFDAIDYAPTIIEKDGD